MVLYLKFYNLCAHYQSKIDIISVHHSQSSFFSKVVSPILEKYQFFGKGIDKTILHFLKFYKLITKTLDFNVIIHFWKI